MCRAVYTFVALAVLTTQVAAGGFAHVCSRDGQARVACSCKTESSARIDGGDCCQIEEQHARTAAVVTSISASRSDDFQILAVPHPARVWPASAVTARRLQPSARRAAVGRHLFQLNCSYRI